VTERPGVAGLRALVTGAAGFVGANLVRHLVAQQADVHVLLRPKTDLWRLTDVLPKIERCHADLTDASAVARVVGAVDPHVVFHLAKHRGDPTALDYGAAFEANLTATLNLLQAARNVRALQRFVHAGSSLEYDLSRAPLRESEFSAPMTVHGVTKAAASLLCTHFAIRHQMPTVVLRFFTVYGPWEDGARFVPSLMVAAIEGRPVHLTKPGHRHDWIYVGDVVDACIRSATTAGIDGEILNIGTGVQTTNEDIVGLVEASAGHRLVRACEPFPSRSWDSERWVADMSKTRHLLGWEATTTLREGLGMTLGWFRTHLDHYAESAGRPS
jgi:nucleoside-diphosphate-sugar epimerase